MDAANTAAINCLLTKSTNLTTLTPIWPQTIPQIFNLNFSTNPSNKNISLLLTNCSTKPNVNRENAIDENLTVEPSSNSRTQKQAKPTSIQSLSSSHSLFSRGLVFDLGTRNSWDSLEIGSPVVKRYLSDDEERWYMWYHGRSGENPGFESIGLAVSSNGIHWERGGGAVKSGADVGLVMNCSKDWWAFDTQSIRPGEIVIMSSTKVRSNNAVYWLYYTGFSSENVEFSDKSLEISLKNPERAHIVGDNSNEIEGKSMILKSLPGLAMSQDGRHWARIEGEHHSGALFDVGSDGEWDSLFIASPQVVYHGSGDLRMYYHSFDAENGHFAVGIARSRDGMRWVKLGKILGGGANGAFDECGIVNPKVTRNKKNGTYLMVYECVASDGERSIGFAVSSDGLKQWKRVQDFPALKKSEENGWDCEGVGSPCLVQMDGELDEWRLYYRGIGQGGRTGIGLAISQGNELNNFQRWTGFHF
ncbi:Arabinanase/levansucrase/invertase [Forsythia ovata]|uniref:Arabinanase/levansucrase/invertase n=1 Tax=Forsythia ovata TaxID=205694 RepID=A0ABD1XBX2_9LAMI